APIECGDGLMLCGNDCVDTLADRNHCGGCGESCNGLAGDSGAGPACVAGDCVCPDALTMCSNPEGFPICVDLDTDERHCGDCDEPCSVGQECVEGDCEDIMCEGGLSLCGSE